MNKADKLLLSDISLQFTVIRARLEINVGMHPKSMRIWHLLKKTQKTIHQKLWG